MIQIGTKLKSVRSGNVVEVIKFEQGAKRVRLEDGTEKVLTDSNIARWYDEVEEKSRAKQPEEKAIKKESAPKEEVKETIAEAGEVASQFLQRLKTDEKFVTASKKQYSDIRVNGYCIAHYKLRRKKVRVEFKGSDLSAEQKQPLITYPKHFNAVYCHYLDIKDASQMDKAFNYFKEIIKMRKQKENK